MVKIKSNICYADTVANFLHQQDCFMFNAMDRGQSGLQEEPPSLQGLLAQRSSWLCASSSYMLYHNTLIDHEKKTGESPLFCLTLMKTKEDNVVIVLFICVEIYLRKIVQSKNKQKAGKICFCILLLLKWIFLYEECEQKITSNNNDDSKSFELYICRNSITKVDKTGKNYNIWINLL